MLSLLLPPALIPVQWRLVAEDHLEINDGQNESESDSGDGGLFIAGEERFAENHPSSSVLFAEVKQNDKGLSPEARMRLLDSIFLAFDDLVKEAGAVKIETIAGVYVVAANVAGQVDPCHAATLSRLALRFASVIPKLAASFSSNNSPLPSTGARMVECLLGIDSGAVIGGVIGKLLPRYRIFGDTVNTAARMQTSSEPGRVQVREPQCEGCLPREIMGGGGIFSFLPRRQTLSELEPGRVQVGLFSGSLRTFWKEQRIRTGTLERDACSEK